MANIVAVHGINNYRGRKVDADEAAVMIARELSDALGAEVSAAYYADVLRPRHPAQGGVDFEKLTPTEEEILLALAAEHHIGMADAQGRATKPFRVIATALAERIHRTRDEAVIRKVVSGLAWFLRDVSRYLDHADRRSAAQDRIVEAVERSAPRSEDEGIILVAHSLGSVVAYETLWRNPTLGVTTLITLGSPLALPAAIFDRLEPCPVVSESGTHARGARPPQITRWINISDVGDLVAVPQPLHTRFAGLTEHDEPPAEIGLVASHDFRRYLACQVTRVAILGDAETVI